MTIFDQYQMMRTHHLIFGYRGTLTNELITSILQLSESKLKELHVSFRKKKSIINILIECLQNVLYHSNEWDENGLIGKHCIFLIGNRNGEYFVQLGNFIENPQIEALKAKLEYLNTLQKPEVHQLYLDVLEKGQLSEKGGAGLGILRIMKDSGQKIDFAFQKVDANRSFYCMEIKIGD